MRKLSFLALLLCVTAASARQISPQEAKAVANDFFNPSGLNFKTKPVQASPAKNGAETVAMPYYAFNAENGNGFVIISGDDRFNKILGYSDRGSFDAENLPPQLKALLDQFAKKSTMTNWSGTHSSWNSSFSSTRADKEVLLKTANWGQGAPYNAECPDMGGFNAPTGCVATAMSIIMKYHTWPATYNWDAMPMEIEGDGENPPAANPELARLMKDAGEAVYMGYGPQESGANMGWVGHRMQQVFKYSPDCQYITQQNFENADWLGLLKSNLDEGNPVIYQGTNKEVTMNHAFIVDGYNSDGYHVNWGWDGMANGYFALDALSPFEGDDFSCNNGMVINLVPDKTGKEYSDWFIDYGYLFAGMPMQLTISVKDVKPGEVFHIGGFSPQVPANFDGEYGIALVDKDGKIKEMLKSFPYTNTEDKLIAFSYYFTDLTVKGEVSPTDRLQVVTKAAGDSDYKFVLGTLESPSYLSVVNNTPKENKIKFDVEEGIVFYYRTGVNDNEEVYVTPGTSEINVLQGLAFEYHCFSDNLAEDERIILSLKGNLIYGDQLYAVKTWSTFFEVLSDYDISAKIVTLKDSSIDLATAGSLKNVISPEEGMTIRNLTVTGKMNAYDFWYIRDNFPALESLDLRKVDIEAVTASDDKYFESDGDNKANYIPDWALQALMNLQTLILPENLEGIASDSLGALDLYGITIPKGVEYIGLNVLFSNQNLEYVCLLNPEPVDVSDCVFTSTRCPENGTLYVPVGSIDKYKAAPVWQDFKNIVEGTLPDKIKFTVTKDGLTYDCVFKTATLTGCDSKAKDIVIPESFIEDGVTVTVNKISNNVFSWNTSLESVVMPNSVTEIGGSLFMFCENLKSATLSDALTELPYNTFYACNKLQEFNIPSNLKKIQTLAFAGTALESVTLPKGIVLENGVYESMPNLETVVFKGNPERGESIFGSCWNLKNFLLDTQETVALDGLFGIDDPVESINIFTSSPEKNFDYSGECVIYVPGQCADKFAVTRAGEVIEMWRYNVNRKEGIMEIVPQIEGIAIDKVTINGKAVQGKDDIYPIEDGSKLDVIVEYTLLGRQKMTTNYTAQFNENVADAPVSGVNEIISSESAAIDVYGIDGLLYLKGANKEDLRQLKPGVYIIREGSLTRKITIGK